MTKKFNKLHEEVIMLRITKKTQGQLVFELKQNLEDRRKANELRTQKKDSEINSIVTKFETEIESLK
jgi:hypothetical protein